MRQGEESLVANEPLAPDHHQPLGLETLRCGFWLRLQPWHFVFLVLRAAQFCLRTSVDRHRKAMLAQATMRRGGCILAAAHAVDTILCLRRALALHHPPMLALADAATEHNRDGFHDTFPRVRQGRLGALRDL